MMAVIRHITQTILTFFLLWLLGLGWFISMIPASATLDATTTDAIVVLTGGSLRLERGLTLLVAKRAPLLFVSGVEEGVTLPSLMRGKEVSVIAPQVPLDKIELGHMARSTLQNAEETHAWAKQHHIKSIRLVTGNYHMPRSIWVMQRAMADVTFIGEPVFPAEFYHSGWWMHTGSIRLVVSEYHKFIATFVADVLGVTAEE